MISLSDSISIIPGIGAIYAKILHKYNINTVADLLMTLPKKRTYIKVINHKIRSEDIVDANIFAMNCTIVKVYSNKKFCVLQCQNTENHSIQTALFGIKSSKLLYTGREICIYGKFSLKNTDQTDQIIINDAKVLLSHQTHIAIVKYNIDKIHDAKLHKMINFILSKIDIKDPIDLVLQCINNNEYHHMYNMHLTNTTYKSKSFASIIKSIPHVITALHNIHNSFDEYQIKLGLRRLALNEALLYVKSLSVFKSQNIKNHTNYSIINRYTSQIYSHNIEYNNSLQQYLDISKLHLQFKLTDSQKQAIHDIIQDLIKDSHMFRVLYGDVGSGKSIVAFLSLIYTSQSGKQAILLAPTDILATQHYASICEIYPNENILFITGKNKSSKPTIYPNNAIIIGTHAILYKAQEFQNIGLLIVDEQHKFGVMQRMLTTNTTYNYLSMTATPIPRTFAMAMKGIIQQSHIKSEFRQRAIRKFFVQMHNIHKIYDHISTTLSKGRSIFWVCTLINKSAYKKDFSNVMDRCHDLINKFGEDRVIYLHSKMKQFEKDKIIDTFYNQPGMVMVSTTMIEVGVNVPHADIMVIENAEMFGLAQLYQLMGRVGRGNHPGECYFLLGKISEDAKSRMIAIRDAHSGLDLAKHDANIRGYGCIFGTEQSGSTEYKFFDIEQDDNLVAICRTVFDILPNLDIESIRHLHKTTYVDKLT